MYSIQFKLCMPFCYQLLYISSHNIILQFGLNFSSWITKLLRLRYHSHIHVDYYEGGELVYIYRIAS